MSFEIIGLATFTAKDGKTDELKRPLCDLIEPTRKESGCLHYSLNQSLNNPKIFTMIERFKDQQAFDLHTSMPYLEHFRKNILDKLVEKNSKQFDLYQEISA